MPLSTSDPLLEQYKMNSSTGIMGRLSSSPQQGQLNRNVTPGPTAVRSQPATAAPAPAQPAAPAATPSSTAGEWTMPGITDPSWFQVSRGYQLQADTASQNAQMQRANLDAQTGLTRSQIGYEGETARRDVSYDAEGRGILRSGEHERNLAEQMRQEQMRLNQLDVSAATSASNIEQDLATRMGDLRRGFAEQGQTAAQQQYIRDGIQQAQLEATNATTPQPGSAVGANGQPLSSGLFVDDQGNYYQVTNGAIKNVGWDVVNAYGQGAFQALGSQNSNDFRKAAGVTW